MGYVVNSCILIDFRVQEGNFAGVLKSVLTHLKQNVRWNWWKQSNNPLERMSLIMVWKIVL